MSYLSLNVSMIFKVDDVAVAYSPYILSSINNFFILLSLSHYKSINSATATDFLPFDFISAHGHSSIWNFAAMEQSGREEMRNGL